MPSTKISALASGNPAQTGDLLPIDRAGANFSVTATSVAALVPAPAPTTLGGVKSKAAVASNFLTQVATDGTISAAQPAYTDISGTPTLNTNALFGFMSAGLTQFSNMAVTAGGAPSAANNNVHVTMFNLDAPITINNIVYQVQTLSASDKWGFGIYDSAGATKLVDTGILSPTGTGTFSVAITPVTLQPGIYFFAQTSSGLTALSPFFPNSSVSQIDGAINKNRNRHGLATNASVGGQLPATLGVITTVAPRAVMVVWFEN